MIGELIYYEGDISLVEQEEFSYLKQVQRLDENGELYTTQETVNFFQTFEQVPEMVQGVYLTLFSDEDQATVVQDFMEVQFPSTELVGNWNINGSYYIQQGTSAFNPQTYSNYLSGVSIASSILTPLPQVMNYSGWKDRNLNSPLVLTWFWKEQQPREVIKNTDVIVLNSEYQSTDPTILNEPQFEYRIQFSNMENQTANVDIQLQKNGVDIGVANSFQIPPNSNYLEELTGFLTGVTIEPNVDRISIEVRSTRDLEVQSVKWYAKYQV